MNKTGIDKKIARVFVIFFITLIYWYVADIHLRIFPDDNSRVTNLTKYYQFYNNAYLPTTPQAIQNDYLYFMFTYVIQKIGIPFEKLLFFLFFLYYVIFIRVFYTFTSFNNWFVYFFLVMFTTFWMDSLVGAALRQGIAFMILLYFLFRSNTVSFSYSLFILLLATSFHLSALIFIVFIFFERYISVRIKLIDIILFITLFLYSLGLINLFSNLVTEILFNLNYDLRSLHDRSDHSTAGFSIYKLIAIAVPAFLFRFTVIINKNVRSILANRIYFFFVISVVAGMFMSNLTYHDRIMLYGWAISPIMLAYSVNYFLIIFVNSQSKNNHFGSTNNRKIKKNVFF
jgi:hypothetical protein